MDKIGLATSYTWGGNPCIRFNKGVDPTEKHPCYYCGTPQEVGKGIYCLHCEFYRCKNCGKCFCNVSADKQVALRYLRDRYCCDIVGFESGKQEDDLETIKSLDLVPHFFDALDYCRKLLGVKQNEKSPKDNT